MDDFDFDFEEAASELGDGTLLEPGPMPEIRDRLPSGPLLDSFRAEVERLHQAALAAGITDEFYQLVRAQAERRHATNAAVARVGNPPSATDHNLGGIATLQSDTKIVSQVAARWQGLDAETGPIAITLGIVSPVPVAQLVVRPFAYLRWGGFGNNFQAEVDIGTGRQLCVSGSSIEIDVALDALTASNQMQVTLAASLSFKPNVRTSSAIRTRYIDGLAQGNTSNVVVPPFAVGILPVQMSDRAGAVQLDFVDSSNTIRYSLLVNNGSQVTPIPLTSDIVQVKVTNTTVNAQHIRLPFELSI